MVGHVAGKRRNVGEASPFYTRCYPLQQVNKGARREKSSEGVKKNKAGEGGDLCRGAMLCRPPGFSFH